MVKPTLQSNSPLTSQPSPAAYTKHFKAQAIEVTYARWRRSVSKHRAALLRPVRSSDRRSRRRKRRRRYQRNFTSGRAFLPASPSLQVTGVVPGCRLQKEVQLRHLAHASRKQAELNGWPQLHNLRQLRYFTKISLRITVTSALDTIKASASRGQRTATPQGTQ